MRNVVTGAIKAQGNRVKKNKKEQAVHLGNSA
jgi:hypothetical protein